MSVKKIHVLHNHFPGRQAHRNKMRLLPGTGPGSLTVDFSESPGKLATHLQVHGSYSCDQDEINRSLTQVGD